MFAAVLVRHSGMIAGVLKGKAAFLAYAFVVVFIVVRMFFSIWNASTSVANQRNARKAWNNKIHFYLTKADFDDLAVEPISAAEMAFYKTRTLIVVAYFILIALLTFTWSGLHIGETIMMLIKFFSGGQCNLSGDWMV